MNNKQIKDKIYELLKIKKYTKLIQSLKEWHHDTEMNEWANFNKMNKNERKKWKQVGRGSDRGWVKIKTTKKNRKNNQTI